MIPDSLPRQPDPEPPVWHCQLHVKAYYAVPGDIRAIDGKTGLTLFYLPKGQFVTEDQCINAPAGHTLMVVGPGEKEIKVITPTPPILGE